MPGAEFLQEVAPHVPVVGDDETFQPQVLADDQGHVRRARDRSLGIVHGDHAADGEAGVGAGRVEGRFEVSAADIVEIDVDPFGRGLGQGCSQGRSGVAGGLVVDHRVDPDLVLQETRLLCAAGRGDDLVALQLGDLADQGADGACGTGDEDHIAWLEGGDAEQASVGGQARHAGDTQEGFGRQAVGVQLLDGAGRGVEGLPPAEVGLDEIAGLEGRVVRGDHLADGTAIKGPAQLEGRDIALHVVHAAAHVGIDGHPGVADLDLSCARRRQVNGGELEVGGGRQALRTAAQADFPGCGHVFPLNVLVRRRCRRSVTDPMVASAGAEC